MKISANFLPLLFVVLFVFSTIKLVVSVTLRDFVHRTNCHVENADIDDVEAASSFWRHNYCKEPLLVRSAASKWKALSKWTDSCLIDMAKNRTDRQEFRVESGSKTERRDKTQLLNMTMAQFIDGYKRHDWYLVTNVPSHFLKSGDLEVPWFLEEGCNSTSHLELQQFPAIVMWMSSGGTKSNLHFDNFESIYCVLSGSKRLILLNPIDGRQSVDIDSIGLHSQVDVDNVDVEVYQSLQSKPFFEANLQRGDCLYLPYHWLHQVETSNERSIAVSFWFHPQDLDRAGCYPLFDQFSPIATKEITSTLMNALSQVNEASETIGDEVSKEENTIPLMSEDKFLEVVIPYLLPANWSPPREKTDKLQEHVRSFFRQLVDLNHDAKADEEELLRINHSSIIWLFHLSRRMFDPYYFAQCNPLDLPMNLHNRKAIISPSLHQEL